MSAVHTRVEVALKSKKITCVKNFYSQNDFQVSINLRLEVVLMILNQNIKTKVNVHAPFVVLFEVLNQLAQIVERLRRVANFWLC